MAICCLPGSTEGAGFGSTGSSCLATDGTGGPAGIVLTAEDGLVSCGLRDPHRQRGQARPVVGCGDRRCRREQDSRNRHGHPPAPGLYLQQDPGGDVHGATLFCGFFTIQFFQRIQYEAHPLLPVESGCLKPRNRVIEKDQCPLPRHTVRAESIGRLKGPDSGKSLPVIHAGCRPAIKLRLREQPLEEPDTLTC